MCPSAVCDEIDDASTREFAVAGGGLCWDDLVTKQTQVFISDGWGGYYITEGVNEPLPWHINCKMSACSTIIIAQLLRCMHSTIVCHKVVK